MTSVTGRLVDINDFVPSIAGDGKPVCIVIGAHAAAAAAAAAAASHAQQVHWHTARWRPPTLMTP
jgi:hypothetical protein